MKVVVDTNVLVSGIFWSGNPSEVLKAWVAGVIELVASPAILTEYLAVIDRIVGRYGREDLAREWSAWIFEHATIVDSPEVFDGCRDPKDNMFVDCALASEAAIIVSGDADLQVLDPIGSIRVLTPEQAVSRFVRDQ